MSAANRRTNRVRQRRRLGRGRGSSMLSGTPTRSRSVPSGRPPSRGAAESDSWVIAFYLGRLTESAVHPNPEGGMQQMIHCDRRRSGVGLTLRRRVITIGWHQPQPAVVGTPSVSRNVEIQRRESKTPSAELSWTLAFNELRTPPA